MRKPIVNQMTFKFFSSADYRDALDRYYAEVDRAKATKPKKHEVQIFSFFNDDEDTYRVAIVGGYGDFIEEMCYSWDEVMTIVYNNR